MTAPANVVEALAAVMADLPAIGKDQRASPQQGGYAYRGIEQVTMHVQPLLAKHKVVLVPRVVEHEIVEVVVNGKPWTDTRLLIEYTIYGPGGVSDTIAGPRIYAIGRDNSDKGSNKAMTQAYKYALLQLLCVSDSADDADGTTHQVSGAVARSPQLPAGDGAGAVGAGSSSPGEGEVPTVATPSPISAPGPVARGAGPGAATTRQLNALRKMMAGRGITAEADILTEVWELSGTQYDTLAAIDADVVKGVLDRE